MPISPDIRRAIEIIDQRIQSLQRIREMLIKEFGVDEGAIEQLTIFSGDAAARSETPPTKTRKQFLADFLKSNGPTSRKDIEAKTGLPKGTIAFALNDKNVFQRLPDGRWTAK